MTIGGIISAVIIGAIIGLIGRLVVPGRQAIGALLTVAVGIGAALLGTWIVGSFRETTGFDWMELLAQIALAAVGVMIVAGMSRTRHV